MKRMYAAAMAMILVVGCGPFDSGYSVEIEGAIEPTTSVDTLLGLRMTEGEESLALVDIEVHMQLAGQQINNMQFELAEDLDEDGKFGVGDLLTVKEPVDLYGPETVGQEFIVEFLEKGEGNRVTVLDEKVWQP